MSIVLTVTAGLPALAHAAGECGVCGGPITEASNLFVITDDRGWEQRYGCPGCGLSELAKLGPGSQYHVQAQDFLTRTMVDGVNAWYLRGSEIGFCCAPFWLSFAVKDHAVKFSKAFGGEVLNFDQALEQAAADHMHDHAAH
ncbi:MAG: hypothetical protein HKO62_14155 [Gammaproteobacteria bacterium]|nr:hypothetical protein [Gammaproteobacteria bacterium]